MSTNDTKDKPQPKPSENIFDRARRLVCLRTLV